MQTGTPFEYDALAPQGSVAHYPNDIVCITAPNEGPFTYRGTNTYLIGREQLTIIDPGPDSDAHFDALMRQVGGRPVSGIFVTHTHRDHSPLSKRLAAATGAACFGEGPHRYTGSNIAGDSSPLDASADFDFVPDRKLMHDELIESGSVLLRALATPGHAENHMAYALEGTGVLFSGDHVMGWATTIVAPPDGSMDRYLQSLELLAKRKDQVFLPGHGGPVIKPQSHCRALKSHRLAREAAILARVEAGDADIAAIVTSVYHATDKRLHGAAALTALAHLERLVRLGKVAVDGPAGMKSIFKPT